MKSQKLNLEQLSIKSFVTDVKEGKQETVKGGVVPTSIATIPACNFTDTLGLDCGEFPPTVFICETDLCPRL